MKSLKGRVAVVAGASRGAGRGVALALGDAGATVYVLGRTTRGGPVPVDGAPGTVEDTADEVTARSGRGIAVRADCTSEAEVAEAFARIARDEQRLDLAVNAVWGAADAYASTQEALDSWGKPFWDGPSAQWQHMMTAGPYAYWLVSRHAVRLMLPARKGLIVGVTDLIMAKGDEDAGTTADTGGYGGQLLWDLSHHCINRLMFAMSVECKPRKIAVVTLMPGFMQTERVERAMTSDALKKQFRYDLSESTEYLGRAVAALAGDAKVLKKSGKIHFVADLAREYGFTDIDGRQVPRFNPFG